MSIINPFLPSHCHRLHSQSQTINKNSSVSPFTSLFVNSSYTLSASLSHFTDPLHSQLILRLASCLVPRRPHPQIQSTSVANLSIASHSCSHGRPSPEPQHHHSPRSRQTLHGRLVGMLLLRQHEQPVAELWPLHQLQLPHSVRFLQACLMYIDPTLCLCVSLMHMSHDLHGYVSLYDLYDLEYLQLRYPLCVMNLDNL